MESYEVQLKDFKKAEQELTGKERVFISQDNNTRSTTIDEIRKPLAEQLNENANLLDKSYNLIKYDKKTIDFNLSSQFTLKSVFRKVLDQDGFLINDMEFGYMDYFFGLNSSAGVFKKILNKGTELLNTDLNKFKNADTADVEEFFISNQTIPAPHFFTSLDIKNSVEVEGLVRNMLVLYKDANNRVQVIFNQKMNQAEIYAIRDGNVTSTYYNCVIPNSFKIGVYCANGTICLFIDRKDGSGWKHLGSRFCANLSDINTLKKWKIGFGFNMSQMTTTETHFTEIKNLEVRICSGFGYRDHTFVKYEDGSPLIKDGKMFLTVSLGGTNIGSSGLGIIEYNPSDCSTKLVSLIYNQIGTGIYADTMAQVLFDRKINAWRALFSGFCSRSSGISTYANQYSGIYKGNLLSGVHYVKSSIMNLEENGQMNCYDGDMIYDESVGKWRLVYVAPFGTLHVVESEDFKTWTKISTKEIGEGGKIVSLGGKYYITSSKEDKMYTMDYPSMNNPKVINVDINPGHPNPHADIIAIPSDSTKYQFLTMDTRGCYDNSFMYAWGSTYVYECENTMSDGYDFDYIEKI